MQIASGTALSASTLCDPLLALNRHRRFNRAVAMCLHQDPLARDTASAIANCARRLNLEFELVNEQLGVPSIVNGLLCNRRLCPFCEWRRTRTWRARLLKGLEAYHLEQNKSSAIFLTLTVRNCQIYELRHTIKQMHLAFKRLTLIRGFPGRAWFRRTEVTVNKGLNLGSPLLGSSLHPHIHALLLVRPSYWSRDYWTQLKWQQEWQMAARLDYTPIIDIRKAKSKPGASQRDMRIAPILEAAKYTTKATDLLSLGELLPAFNSEMKHLRLYGVSGKLRQYIKTQEPEPEELFDSSLVETKVQKFSAVASWFDSIQEYQFTL